MSLELKIEALTAAVVALTAKLESSNVAAPAPVAPAPAPVVQAAPVPMPGDKVTISMAAPAPVAAAPAMPAPPTFAAPVAAPVATGAPFTDGKGLIDYVMGAYKALGPQKGAQIQGVLTGMGYQNINDVKPEHYGQLFAGVEGLK
jgi:2-oxoglutarate dehydrogenase E2 component (dihydrolipoamide succinyltransferase)